MHFINVFSPSGFGIAINCLTTKGTYYSAESFSCRQFTDDNASSQGGNSEEAAAGGNGGSDGRIKSAEEVGEEAALRLLEEIRRGGCVDSYSQCLVLLFMVLGPKDVSKIMLGPLTTQA